MEKRVFHQIFSHNCFFSYSETIFSAEPKAGKWSFSVGQYDDLIVKRIKRKQ